MYRPLETDLPLLFRAALFRGDVLSRLLSTAHRAITFTSTRVRPDTEEHTRTGEPPTRPTETPAPASATVTTTSHVRRPAATTYPDRGTVGYRPRSSTKDTSICRASVYTRDFDFLKLVDGRVLKNNTRGRLSERHEAPDRRPQPSRIC